MKKTLIALAAVAVSSAAMAQVTLSGRIDAAVTSETVTAANGTTSSVGTQLANGTATGSRLTFAGTEDLGGGLKAVFAFEQRFNIDTGTDAGAYLGNAFVGLSGGFGTVHMGRTYTAFNDDLGQSSTAGDTGFTPNLMPAYSSRGANTIKYVSPTMSGVSLTASTSLKESKAAGTKDINAVMLSYGAGPLQLALAQQTEAAGDVTNISAAYDLGMARISIGSGSLDGANSGNDSTGMTFGVTIPMGAMSVSLGYESGETETNAGAKVSESSGFGVYANYAMSKRTSVYAGYKNATTENAAGAKIGGSKLTGVGLIHRF
jgi:predicted porin